MVSFQNRVCRLSSVVGCMPTDGLRDQSAGDKCRRRWIGDS